MRRKNIFGKWKKYNVSIVRVVVSASIFFCFFFLNVKGSIDGHKLPVIGPRGAQTNASPETETAIASPLPPSAVARRKEIFSLDPSACSVHFRNVFASGAHPRNHEREYTRHVVYIHILCRTKRRLCVKRFWLAVASKVSKEKLKPRPNAGRRSAR